jgi:hypothetical protein
MSEAYFVRGSTGSDVDIVRSTVELIAAINGRIGIDDTAASGNGRGNWIHDRPGPGESACRLLGVLGGRRTGIAAAGRGCGCGGVEGVTQTCSFLVQNRTADAQWESRSNLCDRRGFCCSSANDVQNIKVVLEKTRCERKNEAALAFCLELPVVKQPLTVRQDRTKDGALFIDTPAKVSVSGSWCSNVVFLIL